MRQNFFSDWWLLTRTFTFIQKRLQRRVLKQMAGSVKAERVLDVGCGGQPYRPLFKDSIYIGMDLSAERRPTVVGDARSLPFKRETFDCVLCSEVIEHVFECGKVIDEIRRVLRPNGLLILTAPMSWGLHYEPNDFWRFTPYGLQRLLETKGFVVERIERVGGLFSLFGSRIVEGVALQLWRWLRWLPPRVRHLLILLFTIPASLLFAVVGGLLDWSIPTDFIGTAVLARKDNANPK